MEFAYADLHEAVAAAHPSREALVWRGRSLTWAELTDRTRRFAGVLPAHGLGRRAERARRGPVGVGAGPRGAVPPQRQRVPRGDARRVQGPRRRRSTSTTATSPRSCATCCRRRRRAPSSTTRRFAADAGRGAARPAPSSGAPPGRRRLAATTCCPAPSSTRTRWPRAIRRARRRRLVARRPLHPLHRRHHRHAQGRAVAPGRHLRRRWAAASAGGDGPSSSRSPRRRPRAAAPALAARAAVHARRRALDAFSTLHAGRHGRDPGRRRPPRPGRRLAHRRSREQVNILLIVGDAFARPLRRRARAGTPTTCRPAARVCQRRRAAQRRAQGGAARAALPTLRDRRRARLVGDGRQQGHASSRPPRRTHRHLRPPAPARVVVDDDLTAVLAPGDDELGWLAQTGRVPLGYLGDAAKTARTFPVIDGVRYSVPGDRARLRADGVDRAARPRLGHDQLRRREDLRRGGRAGARAPPRRRTTSWSSGGPSERWGNEVVAVVQLRDGRRPSPTTSCSPRPPSTSPATSCRRRSCSSTTSSRSPAGKADYAGPRPLAGDEP